MDTRKAAGLTSKLDRRRFLGVSAGTGLLLRKPATLFGTQANSSVKLGLIGCGSRGNWISPFFHNQAAARIVSVADVIRENLDKTRDKLGIDGSHVYYGPDAYRELANAKLDGVIIETPTYYHPEHALAAVEAGKHVYDGSGQLETGPSSAPGRRCRRLGAALEPYAYRARGHLGSTMSGTEGRVAVSALLGRPSC